MKGRKVSRPLTLALLSISSPVALALAGAVLLGCAAPRGSTVTATPSRQLAGATPTAPPRPAPTPVTEAGVDELLRRAVCWLDDPARARTCLPPSEDALEAILEMGASGDQRFVAPLMDMRWLELGWQREVDEALIALTSTVLGDARAWYEWEAARPQALPLPRAYASWKARLLAFVDPTLGGLIEGAGASGMRVELLVWAGVRVGEVPGLDEPRVVHRLEQGYLDGGDEVYGIFINGEGRAYPRRILAWHPVVEDSVSGAPVLIAYCAVCGGAAAFVPLVDGEPYRFRDSGLVYDGRRLLVDDHAQGLWDPFTGRALSGPLGARGVVLERWQVAASSWDAWSSDHPNTGVLSLDTGHVRDYSEEASRTVDGGTQASRFPLAGEVDARLPAATPVVGLTLNGETRAYVASELRAQRIAHDVLGGERIVLLASNASGAIRVYHAGNLEVSALGEGTAVGGDGLRGDRWFVEESRLFNTLDGRELGAVAARDRLDASWAAWSRAHPDSSIWRR